jgi:hypothetical protein
MRVTDSLLDWRAFPPMLRCEHLKQLYPYTLLTIRKMAQQRSSKIPTPCGSRPFVFRRDDVRRHYLTQGAR